MLNTCVSLLFLGSGLVMDYDPMNGVLYASGDVRSISHWDLTSELKVQVRRSDLFMLLILALDLNIKLDVEDCDKKL